MDLKSLRLGGLYQVDIASGQASLIDQNGLSASDLAVDSTVQLFGWMEKHNPTDSGLPDTTQDQLVLFNLPARSPSTFATLERPGFSSRSGLTFRSDGSLVLKSAPNPFQPDGVFYQVNPNDGTVLDSSPVGIYDGITHNPLAFDGGDVAYTIARRSGSSVLQTINLATGQTTDVLDVGIASVSAITFAPSNVIPEPSVCSLLIVATVTIIGRRRYRVG